MGDDQLNAGMYEDGKAEDQGQVNAYEFEHFAIDQSGDALPFYEIEGQILLLWDRLNEVKLEREIAEQKSKVPPKAGVDEDDLTRQLDAAEKDLLKARAEYLLRQSVIEDTVIASPILNAIHSADNASGTERSLRPLLARRDVLEMALTNLASALQSTLDTTKRLQVNNKTMSTTNRAKAAELSDLAAAIKARQEAATNDADTASQLKDAEIEALTAKKQWRTMKAVVAAVVTGSGISWAGDEALKHLVLEPVDGPDG